MKSIVLLCISLLVQVIAQAETKTATIQINKEISYQKITGFGGFVCSGTFAYNHMSTAEIKKIWGKESDAGYNIMRLYIPIGKSSWSQSLETAKLAKSLGIIVFASPWSMPAEWKTNNNIAAVYKDNSGVEQVGSLKEEFYEAYANYLNDYVTYLHNNGVELDAISIQNEPDMKAEYAGCIWTPAQMASFIKNYGHLINCKIIAAEGVGITDNYANALLADNVLSEFDIFGGHQYGAVQTTHKNFLAKGKEVWMTEYLINWNSDENTTRNFNWSKDAFNFASKLNAAMNSNVSAWIHYASKRFYGLMGDGTNGTTNGALTKRGHILSHYAKSTIGSTRIEHTIKDNSNVLEGSSYLSATGDSIIVMIINASGNTYTLTVDLPFYSQTGTAITTTELLNQSASQISFTKETFRPQVNVSASSFTTLIFTKSRERQTSKMVGQAIHFNKIEEQITTNSSFGTTYNMSGKTVTFDHSNSLVSANTTANNGYLKLNDRYNTLTFHINNITSTGGYTSANTTLYYINSKGVTKSYNYGTISFVQGGNSDWNLDISTNVLTDGCTGILGISNGNWNSILSITFGDVYFKISNERGYQFEGEYNQEDSNLLDCLEDKSYTSLDFTAVTGLTSEQNWNAMAANLNGIYYVSSGSSNTHPNVISGNTCNNLLLSDLGGSFYVPTSFTATTASYSRTFNDWGVIVLPFASTVPAGAKAYTMLASATEVICTLIDNNQIPANTPVLIEGNGLLTFIGSGEIAASTAQKVNDMNLVYISMQVPVSSYTLATVNGETAFYKATSSSAPAVIPFSAYLTPVNTASAASLPLRFGNRDAVDHLFFDNEENNGDQTIYDLSGRRINQPQKGGIYIQNGKKFIF